MSLAAALVFTFLVVVGPTFMKHVIRIELAALRCPLVLVLFPFDWLRLVTCMVRDGFGRRLFIGAIWDNCWGMFWACWDGHFVPRKR